LGEFLRVSHGAGKEGGEESSGKKRAKSVREENRFHRKKTSKDPRRRQDNS